MSRPRKTPCANCGKPLTGARTVINGLWHCATCTYKHDYPDKEATTEKRVKAPPIQKEALFSLPPQKQNSAPPIRRQTKGPA